MEEPTAFTEQEYATIMKILRKQNLKETEEALKREAASAGFVKLSDSFSTNDGVAPKQYHHGYERTTPPINFATTKVVSVEQSALDPCTAQETLSSTTAGKEASTQPNSPTSTTEVDSTTAEDKPVVSPRQDTSPLAQQIPIPTLCYQPPMFQPSMPFCYPFSTAPMLSSTRFPLLTMFSVPQQPIQMVQMPVAAPIPVLKESPTVEEQQQPIEDVKSLKKSDGALSPGESYVCESPCIVDATDMDSQESDELCDYTELRRFADDFKARRIRLGYTQGGVGQSLAEKGFCNFAQSTISRFEQMQLSHRNAAAIKKVLEKWLLEMENPHICLSSSEKPACRKRKRRIVFSTESKSFLENMFRCNPRPDRHVIEMLAKELTLQPEEIRIWFCNKRQKERSSSKTDSLLTCSSPESCYSSSSCADSQLPVIDGKLARPPQNFSIEELSKSASSSPRSTHSFSPTNSPLNQVFSD